MTIILKFKFASDINVFFDFQYDLLLFIWHIHICSYWKSVWHTEHFPIIYYSEWKKRVTAFFGRLWNCLNLSHCPPTCRFSPFSRRAMRAAISHRSVKIREFSDDDDFLRSTKGICHRRENTASAFREFSRLFQRHFRAIFGLRKSISHLAERAVHLREYIHYATLSSEGMFVERGVEEKVVVPWPICEKSYAASQTDRWNGFSRRLISLEFSLCAGISFSVWKK